MATNSFYDVITSAVNDLAEHGFDSVERVTYWERQIRMAAERVMLPAARMDQKLREALTASYRRMVEGGGLLRFHPGIDRFTLNKVQPHLRAELDRRIMASANLIRLNREQAVQKTLQRFSGWSTSIPVGGSGAVEKIDVKKDIRKALAQLPFEERRVLIDQGHKLTAAINEVVAQNGGALAVVWHSNWRQAGYNYREDHKERDGNVYTIRGSWALDQGLMKPAEDGYYDEITSVAEEPFCRCFATWVYALRRLPADMLTKKGQDALRQAQQQIRAA